MMSDQAKRLRHLLTKPKSENKQSVQIYAISSGKGGVGKSNIVLNTAIELQRLGKSVLIIDADFGFSNIDVLCNLMPAYTLQDVLSQKATLNDIIVTGPEGIKVLVGGTEMTALGDVSSDYHVVLQQQFLQLDEVDVILIDTGAGLSKALMMYVTFAQELIMILTPEPTSLTDAYSFLKVIDQYHLKRNVSFIVNKVENEIEGKRTYQMIQETISTFLSLSTVYLGSVREDKAVSMSVKKQLPFVLHAPSTKAAQDIKKIASLVAGQQKPDIKGIQEVFSRLLRVFT